MLLKTQLGINPLPRVPFALALTFADELEGFKTKV